MKAVMISIGLLFVVVTCVGQDGDDRKAFVAIYRTGDRWQADKTFGEQSHAAEHSAFLANLRKEGVITAGLRAGEFGYIFFRSADVVSAQALFDADPSVKAKTFAVSIMPANIFYKGCLE